MTMLQTGRMFALVDLAMAHAMIGCWNAKYECSSWRPITAIQLAGSDGNVTSAHSCASGAAARI